MIVDEDCCVGCDGTIGSDDEYEVITFENGAEEYWHSRCLAEEPEDDDEGV